MVTSGLEPGVLIEAGAAWRQQHGGAGNREPCSNLDCFGKVGHDLDRVHPGERCGDRCSGVTDGNDRIDAMDVDGHRRQIDTLVVAAGDQHQ